LTPAELDDEVYAEIFVRIVSFHAENRHLSPTDIINCFEELDARQKASALFMCDRALLYAGDAERVLGDAVKKVKTAYLDSKIALEDNAEAMQKLLESKINVDRLYIKVSDG
jgi:hypothetical protein